jgi:hypothetical protein
MTRLIHNLTGLLFGLTIAALLALWYVSAHSAEPPPKQTYIGVVVAYQNGEVVASESIGYAANQADCMKGVQSVMVEVTPKPGISLAALCTPAPPAPPAATMPPQSKDPVPGHKGEGSV